MNITRKYRLMEKIAGIKSMERALRAAKKQLTSNVDPSTEVAKGVTLERRNVQLRNQLRGTQPATSLPELMQDLETDLGLVKKIKGVNRSAKKMRGANRLDFDDIRKIKREARYSQGSDRFYEGPSESIGMFPAAFSRDTASLGPGYKQIYNSQYGPKTSRLYRRRIPDSKRRRLLRLAEAKGARNLQQYLVGRLDKNFGGEVSKFNRASESDQIAMLRQGAFERFLGPDAIKSIPFGSVDKDALSSLLQPKGYTPGSVMADYMSARLPGYKNISNADYIKNYKNLIF